MIAETDPNDKDYAYDDQGASDKEVDWLNQVSSNDRRSNSNTDQIGKSRGDRSQHTEHSEKSRKTDARIEKSGKSRKSGFNDSLEYSESEQLQFSHPPKESRGPRGEISSIMPDI